MINRRSSLGGGFSASLLCALLATSAGCSSDDSTDGSNTGGSADASADRGTGGGGTGGGTGGSAGAGASGNRPVDGSAAGTGGSAATDANSPEAGPVATDDAPTIDAGPGEPEAAVDPDASPYVVPTCLPATVTTPLISDFTYGGGAMTSSISWGDYNSRFSGFSYFYPEAALASDVTQNAWSIAGVVNDYAGFGLGFYCKSDASAYSGISFTIRGTLGGPLPPSDAGIEGGVEGGARDAASDARDAVADARDGASAEAGALRLTMFIGSAPTDIASLVTPSWGTCVPRVNQYDGTCVTPSATIDVTPGGRTYRLPWSAFTGGRPTGVDPAQLTRIYWVFTWNGAGTPPYPVNVTVDDVTFIEASDAAAPAEAAAPSDAAAGDAAASEAAANDGARAD